MNLIIENLLLKTTAIKLKIQAPKNITKIKILTGGTLIFNTISPIIATTGKWTRYIIKEFLPYFWKYLKK